jgi:flagellar motility protein MotE (MotC chaperone)
MKTSESAKLFPVLLAAALFLLLFKVAALMFDGPQQIAGVASAVAQEQPKPAAQDTKTTAEVLAKEQKKTASPAPENVASKPPQPTEARILQRLAERRRTLEKRGKELDLRENLIRAAEAKIDQKIKELKKISAKIEKIYSNQDNKRKTRLKKLVSMYANMKPNDSARLFNKLNLRVLLDVAEQMSARKMSPIMAAMDNAAAKRLTLALAERAGRQQNQQRLKKTGLPKINPDNPS